MATFTPLACPFAHPMTMINRNHGTNTNITLSPANVFYKYKQSHAEQFHSVIKAKPVPRLRPTRDFSVKVSSSTPALHYAAYDPDAEKPAKLVFRKGAIGVLQVLLEDKNGFIWDELNNLRKDFSSSKKFTSTGDVLLEAMQFMHRHNKCSIHSYQAVLRYPWSDKNLLSDCEWSECVCLQKPEWHLVNRVAPTRSL